MSTARFIVASAILLWGCAVWGEPAEVEAPAASTEAEVQALSADVDLLEQLNRLQLSAQQIESLAALSSARQTVAGSFAPKRENVLNALASALRQKRQLLLRDEPVPDELEEKIARLNTELVALKQAEVEQCSRLVTELRKLLSEAQIALLTGQREAYEGALNLLQWLRGLGDKEYEEEVQAAAEELALPEQGLTVEEIRKICDRARALDEQAFDDQGGALAEKLLPAYAPSEAAQTQMIMDLLSNPRLNALLRDKKAAQGG
jgi:pyruvate-formate lyase